MKRVLLATVVIVVVALVVGGALWATQRNTVPKGKAVVSGLRSGSGATPLAGAVAFRNVSANVISSPIIISVNTDKNGKFTKELPAGQYEVSGTNDGDCTPVDLTLKSGSKQNISLTCVK